MAAGLERTLTHVKLRGSGDGDTAEHYRALMMRYKAKQLAQWPPEGAALDLEVAPLGEVRVEPV